MIKKAVLIAFLLSCTDPDRTLTLLRDQGYTHIEITGHSMLCGESDSTCTGFEAVNPNGHHVVGAVGCGRANGCSKGCTIRFD